MASQSPQSQAQPQAQQPQQPQQHRPTDCLLHIILKVKCARATHDFLREIFPVPASEGRIFLLPGDINNHHDNDNNNNNNDDDDDDKDDNNSSNTDRDTVFIFPYMALRFTSTNPLHHHTQSSPCPCPSTHTPGPRDDTTSPVAQLAVLVENVQLVRARLAGVRGVRFWDVPAGAGAADGLEWLEFRDLDGYCWRVGRLDWGAV